MLRHIQLFATHGLYLSMGFPRQKYWSGLPFLSPGDLSDPGIELASPVSPALAGEFFTAEPLGNSLVHGAAAKLPPSVVSVSVRPHGL